MSISRSEHDDWDALHRACTRCVEAGYIPRALPIFSRRGAHAIMLVGQAPGPVEQDVARPFAGRAGRELMRWLARAGFRDEADVRDRIQMTSMTSCFPGRALSGTGDRRPSAAEVRLCSTWLDGDLMRTQPRVIIAVGTLAISRFLPRRRLGEIVGSVFHRDGAEVMDATQLSTDDVVVVPLPHPSGASRWSNDPSHVELREEALRRLAEVIGRLAPG